MSAIDANKKPKVETLTLARDLEQASTILESQIKAIAEAGKTIERSALKKGTLVRLIAVASGVSMTDVRAVLDALPGLDTRFLK